MKTNCKSLVSLLLVFAMVLSFVPGVALTAAATEETTTVILTDGVSIVEGYDDYVGKNWGSLLGMPETVEIDGVATAVTWENPAKYVNVDKVGSYAVPGTVNGVANAVAFIVKVHPYNNLMAEKNSDLEGSWLHWGIAYGDMQEPFVTDPVLEGEYAASVLLRSSWTETNVPYQVMYTKTPSKDANGNILINRTTDYANRVVAEGAGDYFFGLYAMSVGDTLGEEDGALNLSLQIARATNDDEANPEYDKDRRVNAPYTAIKMGEYTRFGSTAYFDAQDTHLRFYVYATGENLANDRIYLDKFEMVQIKKAVQLENVPAEITSVAAQPVYGLMKNYDQYAGENWQEALALPTQVEVALSDGTTTMVDVSWDFSRVDLTTEGTYVVVGDLADADYLNPNALKAKQFIQVQTFDNLLTVNPSLDITLNKSGVPQVVGWAVDSRYHDATKLESVSYGVDSVAAKFVAVEGVKFGRLTYNGSTSQTALGSAIAASGVGQYWISIDVWADTAVTTTFFPRLYVYYGSKSQALNIPEENRVAFGTSVQSAAGIVTVDSLTKDLDGDGTEDAITKAMFTVEKSASNDKTPVIYLDNALVLPLKVTLDITPSCEHTPADAVQENVIPAECGVEGFYNAVVYCADCGELLSREGVVTDALEHIYEATLTEPTCGAAGYITNTCTLCGDTYKEAGDPATGEHTYDDDADTDCNVCGEIREVKPAEPVVDASLNIQKHTMQITSDLKLGFSVDVADVKDATDFYVVFYKADGITAQNVYTTVTKEAIIAGGVSNNRYYAYYPKVLAGEMNDAIEAVLYVVDADGTIRCSETDTYSVVDYLTLLMTTYEAYPAYVNYMTVSVELLGYGTAAQENFGYKTETPANAIVFEKGWDKFALAEDPTPVNNRNWGATNNSQKVIFKGSGLKLEESIYSNIRIDASKLTAEEFAALKMVVKAADGTIIETIESSKFSAHTAANNYWITITKILPKDMAKVYNLEMYIGETLVSSTATYSVESYVRLLQDSGLSAGAVALAALRYGTAAALLG